MRAIFKITESSGKTYRIFADGHAEGFEPGAVICNYIPALLTSVKVTAERVGKSHAADNA